MVSGLLRGDHASRAAYYVSALQNGWMSVNEIRELENMNPIPEGDQHYIQMNMQTLTSVEDEPPQEEEPQPEAPPEPPAEEPDPVDDEEQA